MSSRVKIDITQKIHVGFSTDVLVSVAASVVKFVRPQLLKIDSLTLSVVFVDDKEIQEINKNQRGVDEATDVISFSYLEEVEQKAIANRPIILGELIISTEALKRQAKDYHHSQEEELRVLFVHGLLHVLGYGHDEKNSFKQMAGVEQEFLGDKSGLLARGMVE